MAEILLVNPRKRGKKRRKMSALQRKYFGKRRRKSSTRAAAPRRRRRRSVAAIANPRRRRRRSYAVRSIRRRRKSNPSMRGLVGSVVPTIKRGFIGAVGGIGLDLAMGQLSSRLPASLSTGMARHAVKAAVAMLVGVLGNFVLKGKGRDLSDGAMTIVLHDAMKEQLSTMLPASLPLGEYLSTGPAIGYDMQPALPLQTGVGEYLDGSGAGDGLSGMGEYVDNDYSYGY